MYGNGTAKNFSSKKFKKTIFFGLSNGKIKQNFQNKNKINFNRLMNIQIPMLNNTKFPHHYNLKNKTGCCKQQFKKIINQKMKKLQLTKIKTY